MIRISNLMILILFIVVCNVSHAQTINKESLSIEGAMMVIDAAVREAVNKKAPGAAIAVVDDGGNLMAVKRLDNTFAAGANISIGKARTAAIFKKPTSVFENIIKDGRTPMVALNDFTPLQGGVPIILNGQIVGAVGVSGAASAQQDEELAIAGAAAISSGNTSTTTGNVTYLDNNQVSSAFTKGSPLIETTKYKVHASRREAPGMAEVHLRDTDIIYVLEGTSSFVTGGEVINGKTTAPDEIRGTSIKGGTEYKLKKGDVMVVPNGTPHWFREVNGPFLYYVVKTID